MKNRITHTETKKGNLVLLDVTKHEQAFKNLQTEPRQIFLLKFTLNLDLNHKNQGHTSKTHRIAAHKVNNQ